MYQFPYAEIALDDMTEARRREREAFDAVIARLALGRSNGMFSRETTEALYYVERLWKILMEDLAHAENRLPEAMRASLISIGIWMLKEIEAIRRDRVATLDGIIDINRLVRDGMK